MAGSKVAIVGAGRMGRLLAGRLPGACRKVFISRQKADAQSLADEVGGVAADHLSAVRGCDWVILTVPGSAILSLFPDLLPHLSTRAIVVNMATDLPTMQLRRLAPDHPVVAAKVIGHAREMAAGSPGVVVIDQLEGVDESELIALFQGLGHVVRAEEDVVLKANTAVAEEMVQAERSLRRRLDNLGLPSDLIRVAITTTGPGVLRSLSEGDAGPFVQEIIRRLQQEGAPAT